MVALKAVLLAVGLAVVFVVAALPPSLLFRRCFFSFVSFAPSVNNVLLSLQQLRGDVGGGGLGSGLDGGRPFFLFFSVFFFQLCSPLFLFPPSAFHGAVVDWEGSGSLWRWKGS